MFCILPSLIVRKFFEWMQRHVAFYQIYGGFLWKLF